MLLDPKRNAEKSGHAGKNDDAKEKKYMDECGAANFFAIKNKATS